MNNDNVIRFNVEERNNYEKSDKIKNNICPFCDLDNLKSEKTYIDFEEGILFISNKFNIYDDLKNYLIIESSDCEKHIHNLDKSIVLKILNICESIKKDFLDNKNFSEVLIFKQYGPYSGASVSHGHIQLIGLEKPKIDYDSIKTSVINSILLYENNNLKVSLSEKPCNEFIEFNIEYDELDLILVEKVQLLINYILDNSSGFYSKGSYSFSMHDYEGHKLIKILERKKSTTFKTNYGISLVNNFSDRFLLNLKSILE